MAPPGFSFNVDELFGQDFLHISEPDLVNVDGPPHSPCPSSASLSSSHLPSPELCPVRLQEVNLNRTLVVTKQTLNACIALPPVYKGRRGDV